MTSFSMDCWWNIYQSFLLDEHFSKRDKHNQTTKIYRVFSSSNNMRREFLVLEGFKKLISFFFFYVQFLVWMAVAIHVLRFLANRYVEKRNDLWFHVHHQPDDNRVVFEDFLSSTSTMNFVNRHSVKWENLHSLLYRSKQLRMTSILDKKHCDQWWLWTILLRLRHRTAVDQRAFRIEVRRTPTNQRFFRIFDTKLSKETNIEIFFVNENF